MKHTKILTGIMVGLLIALPLAGCGGGSSPVALPNRGGATVNRHQGSASFTVKWPARATRLIPDASQSIVIALQPTFTPNGTKPVAPIIVPRPADGQPQTVTVTFSNLELGDWNATATAYPTTDGTGIAQANKSTTVPFTVKDGDNAPIVLTMDSTILTLEVLPIPTSSYAVGETLQLIAEGRDAAGSIVITSLRKVTWTSSNTAVATVTSPGGLVTFVGSGTTTFTATDPESGKSATTAPFLAGFAGLNQSAWPKFHGDAQNTGQATSGNATTGTLVSGWPFTTGNSVVFSSPAIAQDGTVYVGAYDKKVYAINPNGSLKWFFTTGDIIESSPAIGRDGTIYVGSADGHLYALNPQDGSLRWQYPKAGDPTNGAVLGSPTLNATRNLVYFGTLSPDSKLYALDSLTGALRWQFTGATGGIQNTPAFSPDNKALYFASLDGQVFAVDPATGTGLNGWPFTTNGAIYSSPAVGTNGTVYIGSFDGNVYALNPNGGKVWVSSVAGVGAQIYTTPAISKTGQVYFASFDNTGSNNSRLYAVDSATGNNIWAFPSPSGGATIDRVSSSPAIGNDGVVYFGSYDGNLYAVNPDGSQKWKYAIGDVIESSPAIGSDGKVYVGAYNNQVTALQ